jgi:hypothetical protein
VIENYIPIRISAPVSKQYVLKMTNASSRLVLADTNAFASTSTTVGLKTNPRHPAVPSSLAMITKKDAIRNRIQRHTDREAKLWENQQVEFAQVLGIHTAQDCIRSIEVVVNIP